jgi:hypothetical protein
MLSFALGTACALVVPTAPALHVTPAFAGPRFVPRVAAHPTMQAPPAVYSPSKDMAARGGKFYEGRTPEMSKAVREALREVGRRKICVITGASSGLGLACVQALLRDYEVTADSAAPLAARASPASPAGWALVHQRGRARTRATSGHSHGYQAQHRTTPPLNARSCTVPAAVRAYSCGGGRHRIALPLLLSAGAQGLGMPTPHTPSPH